MRKMLDQVNSIEDAMRHFRNFAKKRRDNSLLEKIIEYQIER